MSSDATSRFEPLVIIHFSTNTPNETKNWVIKRLTASPAENDGADLLVRYENDSESHRDILLVGATVDRLLLGAEELRIKKPYKNQVLREFLLSDMSQFEKSENMDNFLLKSEKQFIVWEEIQNLRPMPHDDAVPGIPSKSIMATHDTILNILRDLNFIVSIFPLHEKEQIKLIERDWLTAKHSFYKPQDIRTIRNYFGEHVAYYFAFLEFYTKALVPTAVLGLVVSLWPGSEFFKYSLFCIFNVVWWTVFMERWKRFSNSLAYEWGSYDLQIYQRPRSSYYGDFQTSQITKQRERHYPKWKRALKKYLFSYPLILCFLAVSLWVYFTYYRIETKVQELYPIEKSEFSMYSNFMRLVPSAAYSLLIIPMNLVYKKVAILLTEHENHRLETSYENNLTSKLFIFYFTNCFVGLFYEAFINLNQENVAQLLITFVIFNSIVLKFTEQIGPYVFKRIKRSQLSVNSDLKSGQNGEVVKQAKTLIPFEGTYADYVTIFEQFGYIALFSAVFPWVTVCALLNNILELRADAFKYCYVYQRPFSQRAWNIGSWCYAFEILGSVSIVTNTALIAMQPSVREYFSSYSNAEYLMMFVAAEHILLALRFVISFAIPSVPSEIKLAKLKHLYESNQALRNERERRVLKAHASIQKS